MWSGWLLGAASAQRLVLLDHILLRYFANSDWAILGMEEPHRLRLDIVTKDQHSEQLVARIQTNDQEVLCRW